jgi:DNA-binding transcriptional regulator YiaG
MKYKVYGLADPRNPDVVVYVGVTRKPLEIRLRQHLQDSQSTTEEKKKWIASLKQEGITPVIFELEECEDSESFFIEAKWIGNFKLGRAKRRPHLINRGCPYFKRGDYYLHDRLKTWRGKQLQKTAADILGVPLPTYRNWEYGENIPGVLAMKEIDRKISIPVGEYEQSDKSLVRPTAVRWCDELRNWRKVCKIKTKKGAAEILGVSYQVYSNWEDDSSTNHHQIHRCRELISKLLGDS